jgi:hypothetical protein
MGDDGDVVVGEKEGTAPHQPECADLCVLNVWHWQSGDNYY